MRNTPGPRRLALALPLALVLGACGSGASPAPSSSAAPVDSAAPATPAAVIPTVVKPGVITALTLTDGAPFASVSADGTWTGFDIALMTLMAKNLGLELEITGKDFDTIIPSVAGGLADVAFVSIADTDKRRETVDFTLPNYTGTNNLVVTNDSAIPDGPQQVGEVVGADKTGTKVGVIQATMGQQYAQAYFKDAELVTFPSTNAAILGLVAKTVDSIVIDGQQAYLAQDQYPVHTAFTTVDPANRGAAIVINKENVELRQALNAELRRLLADGTIKALLEQYNPKEPSEPVIAFLEDYYGRFPSDTYPY
jgi:ABC-type amino acid transport substrate-binding protein